MRLTATHIVILASVFSVCLTVLVVLGKLPAAVLASPAAWFFGWLQRSPLSPVIITASETKQ